MFAKFPTYRALCAVSRLMFHPNQNLLCFNEDLVGLANKSRDVSKGKTLNLVILVISLFICTSIKANCRPPVDKTRNQFIIGYGSLMQEASKREDSQEVGDNYPIYVRGFKRGWFEPGTDIGFSTTYLGVTREEDAKMNAVYFMLKNAEAMENYDKREDTYCRVQVLAQHIQPLATQALPPGEYWIYLSEQSKHHKPSSRKPIVQSYVDIFLSGCFQLAEKYHLPHFAQDCVRTTSYWSSAWVNDRLHPRTAYDNDPYAVKIDTLLAKELPEFFTQIRIE